MCCRSHLVTSGANLLKEEGGQQEVDVVLVRVKGRAGRLVHGHVKDLLEATGQV